MSGVYVVRRTFPPWPTVADLERQILDLLETAARPVSTNEIGCALGWACREHWTSGYLYFRLFVRTMLGLRARYLVVKLPHEDARSEARYRLCVDQEDAHRQQLEATEAELGPMRHDCVRRRRLQQALEGLRSGIDSRRSSTDALSPL